MEDGSGFGGGIVWAGGEGDLISPSGISLHHLLFDNHHRQHVPVRVRHSLLRCVVLSRAGTVSPLTSAAIILLINAIAILSEDRFLARSTSTLALSTSEQASIEGSKESKESH